MGIWTGGISFASKSFQEQLAEIARSRAVDVIKEKGLCGCRLSDLPDYVSQRMHSIGFERVSDYFVKHYDGHYVRIYLTKDFSGKYVGARAIITVKYQSEDEKRKILSALQGENAIQITARSNVVYITAEVKMPDDISIAWSIFSGFSENVENLVKGLVGVISTIK